MFHGLSISSLATNLTGITMNQFTVELKSFFQEFARISPCKPLDVLIKTERNVLISYHDSYPYWCLLVLTPQTKGNKQHGRGGGQLEV
jgi:hypothetical protein